ncbi:DNRLRE domain-containing protein [Corallococcus llansteffanensis]|uniref:DNRLRE domain-containing protein n=2 Tax=Corallococcus llansteffanensis TaxID=2316731 RepID=A0A3A8P9L6_9BACT|nr:DNRLRE domain-containing protein [Corallococcus llansteffanensis]
MDGMKPILADMENSMSGLFQRGSVVSWVLMGCAVLAPQGARAASVGFEPASRGQPSRLAALTSLSFTPVKDAMVKQFAPTTNFGAQSLIQVSAQNNYSKEVVLQFNVTGLPAGATNLTAQLRVPAGTTATGRPITAHAVADTGWSETAITWNTRLPMGAALSTVSSHTAGQDSVWDVSALITGNGNVTVGLDTTFSGDTNFTSREGSPGPTLVVSYDTATTWFVYAGNTHAHTSYTSSHGEQVTSGDPTTNGPPSEHHARAKAAGYDFYVTTDHSQEVAFDPTSPTTPAWVATKQQAVNATDSGYVGFWGYEHSENNGPDGTGHINVINSPAYLDALESGVGLQQLYAWIKTQPDTVASFNHPGPTNYNSFGYRDAALTDIFTMLEVINSNDNLHYEGWLAALQKGWKVSPVCGNDNHGFWGITRHTARTFLVAPSRTKAALLDAMKQRRTYAALDTNLHVVYTVNGAIMGSTLASPSTFNFNIQVSDADVGDRISRIEILKDNGVVVQTFAPATPQASVTWTPSLTDTTSRYFFLRVYNEGSTAPMAWIAPVWTGR